MALEALGGADLAERAARAGGSCGPETAGLRKVGLSYLGRDLFLLFSSGKVEIRNGEGPLSPREEIVILHYLVQATGNRPGGRWISFGEIPGGAFYHPVFHQRCQAPLIRSFGHRPEALRAAARALHGESLDLGDVGIRIRALPFLSLALVLWRGDEEFPPSGNLLFDSAAPEYLPLEDLVILAETVVWRMIKAEST